jgi:lipoprotein LpqB-like beta-propeller protein
MRSAAAGPLRRTWVAVAGALALALALAGCVGIPTSGGVQTGGLIVGPEDPDVVFSPSDPKPGSLPEDLLRDFMLALRGPQSDYAVARKFLTSTFASQWNPDAVTTIRVKDEAPVITAGSENELLYTFSSRAFVDSTGLYSEQPGASNQTLAFQFEQEDGEWRISRAPDGIVLSQANFDIVFKAWPLYFLDPSSTFLVPDVRWFPVRGSILTRVARSLLDGPATWLGGGVVLTGFPEGTSIAPDGISVSAGVATVTLSAAASASSAAQRAAMRQQLAATLGVSSVVLKVGPLTLDSPDVGTPPIRAPQVAGQAIVGTADEFGFASGGGITPIEGFSEQLVAAGASAATVGRDQRVIAYLAGGAVSAVSFGDAPVQLDTRAGLIAPSVDPFDFIWSAQGGSATSIVAYGLDGEEHPVSTGISADTRIVAMDVSRDGARVLLTVIEPLGPRVYVAGVVRDADNAPATLNVDYGLDTGLGSSTPLDATWIGERSIAVLTSTTDGAEVTEFEIGGPSLSLGSVEGATQLAGGNFGEDGLRVLADGRIWQHRASAWVATGIDAVYLATQQ